MLALTAVTKEIKCLLARDAVGPANEYRRFEGTTVYILGVKKSYISHIVSRFPRNFGV